MPYKDSIGDNKLFSPQTHKLLHQHIYFRKLGFTVFQYDSMIFQYQSLFASVCTEFSGKHFEIYSCFMFKSIFTVKTIGMSINIQYSNFPTIIKTRRDRNWFKPKKLMHFPPHFNIVHYSPRFSCPKQTILLTFLSSFLSF